MAERGLFSNGVLLVSSNQLLLVFLLALVPLLLGTAAVGGLVLGLLVSLVSLSLWLLACVSSEKLLLAWLLLSFCCLHA